MSNAKLSLSAELELADLLIQSRKMSHAQLLEFTANTLRQLYYQRAAFSAIAHGWGKDETLSLPLDPTRLQNDEQ